MRGHFSIEWMAQSSQPAGTDALSGPAACGTHSESLPGFYCRQRSEDGPEENRNQSLKTFSQHQVSHSDHGKTSLMQTVSKAQSLKVRFTENLSQYEYYLLFIACILLNVFNKAIKLNCFYLNIVLLLLLRNKKLFLVRCWVIKTKYSCFLVLLCWSLEMNSLVFFFLPATTEAGFSSGTEEETSGYESEGGRSLSPSAPAECSAASSPPSPPSGRRPRTAFTAEQICSMERAFKRNAYLGTQDKAELCKKLNLSDKQVKIFD